MSDCHEHDCDDESEEFLHDARLILARWERRIRERMTLWERIVEWWRKP